MLLDGVNHVAWISNDVTRLVLQQRLVISDSTGIVTFPGGSLAVAPPA